MLKQYRKFRIFKQLGEPSKSLLVKAWILSFSVGLLVCCSSSSDDRTEQSDNDSSDSPIDSTTTNNNTFDSTVFTVIGDVPYNEQQKQGLINLIDTHNDKSKSEFVVHVGDIKPGSDACDETVYLEVNEILAKFEAPTFIVLGDNEFNDCDSPEDALILWNTYFLRFNENWDFQYTVEYQEERSENFAWVENGVLFLGLNLVGSSVHDQTEWNKRLSDDADWVEKQFDQHTSDIKAAILFGHANMTEIGPQKFELFTDRFRTAASQFEKPILYVQGDGHLWFQNRPWPEQNIVRLQIEGGANAAQITVNPNAENPFVFDRNFLD